MNVLFVTWDGPHETYLESLFLPLFAAAARHGVRFSVLQLTWGENDRAAAIHHAAARAGIPYRVLSIHRRPRLPSVSVALARGAAAIAAHVRRHPVDVVMPRALLPAAMLLMARPLLPPAVRVVFDADGFVADERVDFAGWSPRGLPYRVLRQVEAQTCRVAHGVMTRTSHGRAMLAERAGAAFDLRKIDVIPNARDEALFAPGEPAGRRAQRARADVAPDAPWVIYAGGLGPQYRPRAMLQLFRAVHERRPDARLHILTRHETLAREVLAGFGGLSRAVTIQRVPPDEVPAYLAAADLGLALRAPTYSQRGVSPIKVAEYLLSGLPVLCNRGVGDLDSQIDAEVGAIEGELDMPRLAERFLGHILPARERYRAAARARGLALFGLEACAGKLAALIHRSAS